MNMKKKKILATLVMLSLMHGSAYATNWTNEYVVDKDMTWTEFTESTGEGGGPWARKLMVNEKMTILNDAVLTVDFNNEFNQAAQAVIVGIDMEQPVEEGKYITGEVLLEGGTLHAIATKKSNTYAIWNYEEYAPEITIKNTNLIFDNYQMGVRFDNGLLKIENYDEKSVAFNNVDVGFWTNNNADVSFISDKFNITQSQYAFNAIGNSTVDVDVNDIEADVGTFVYAGSNAKTFFDTETIIANSQTFIYIEDDAEASVNTNKIEADSIMFAYADGNSKTSIIGNNVEINGQQVVAAAGNDANIELVALETANIQGSIVAGVLTDSNQKATINFKLGSEDNNKIINNLKANELIFKGEALSANNGTINVNLGSGSRWEGRADDFKDADLAEWREAHGNEFNEMFETLNSSGNVNITMQDGSYWNVTGQSWVSSLDGSGVVDLRGDETKGYAVHIGTLSGNNTFVLNLTPEALETSDMIYVQNGTDDKQTLLVANERELVDNKDWDEIRFATVADAAGSVGDSNFDYGGSFGDTYTIKGRGVRNVDYEIKYVAMDEDTTSDEDNNKYNGGDSFDEVKPSENYVQDNYNKIDEGQNSQYIYLVRNENDPPVVNPDEDLTDSGKTVIHMSRANYKNAIYMDRLNKRLGEARYINNEEEQGMWVRLRHDRIGQSGEFRSMNTMYELGYDEKQDCDNGERRVGFAVDYMRGSTTYSDILGKGETKRYGLWLYDTWMGDKGHYADYVAKWGHLSNDFDIRDKDSFERVTGDYSNNVFSVSAEYGRKKDIGNDWYIEPQAQLQLARVTGAEYTTTTQDTKVSVDGINSLIGRAGFRLGRDVDERSTVYIKADLLHEFLGDQTITATDVTGTLREEYENKGTWYDVGFGFAMALSNNSYAFMDFEKSFGNDNDETYQITAGVQWTF